MSAVCGTTEMSKNVMPQTDLYEKPIPVGIDELQKYRREPCACLDEIQSTGAALRAAYSGQAGMGWVLLEKEHTEELSDGTYIKTFVPHDWSEMFSFHGKTA